MPLSKRPPSADINELAALIVQDATNELKKQPAEPTKNLAAVALGQLGGKKGGLARAERLSAKRRREIAEKAARMRWSKKKR